jgi:hypothetical protein
VEIHLSKVLPVDSTLAIKKSSLQFGISSLVTLYFTPINFKPCHDELVDHKLYNIGLSNFAIANFAYFYIFYILPIQFGFIISIFVIL